MVAVTVAARTIGFLREAVIAHTHGASREVDLFLVSLTIPAILVTTVYYSIPNAFVPLWSSSSTKNRQTLAVEIGLVFGSLIVAAFVWWLSGPAIRVLAKGLDSSLQERAVSLLRIGTGTIVFAVLEALLRSRLLAAKHFGLSGLSYMWQGIGIIVAAIGWRESGALGLMWGLVIGTAASAIWNFVLVFGLETPRSHEIEQSIEITSPNRIWVWVALVLLTDSLAQLYAVVDRYLGSYLEPGAIASLNYANLTAGLPSAIIGLALSTAILPFLSDADSAGDTARSSSIIDRSVRWALLFAIPVSVWMFTFGREITSMLFERGAFDAEALKMTSAALSAASLGIVPIAIATVWSRLFYASHSWIPIGVTAIGALIAKAALSVGLVSALGSTGLALATSCAYVVAACISGFMQKDRIRNHVREWTVVAIKSLALVGLPTLVGYIIMVWLIPEQPVLRNLVAVVAMITGLFTLLLGGCRWGIPQMTELMAILSLRRA